MDVHNTHVSAVVAEVGVVREKLRLVFLDEISKPCDRLLQVSGQRPPEFVCVVVDHPVGAHLAGDSGYLSLAALLHVVDSTPDALEPHDSGRLVGLDDLDGAVGGPGVSDDEEVDSLRAVVTQVVLDDVRLVADLERHCEPHGGGG